MSCRIDLLKCRKNSNKFDWMSIGPTARQKKVTRESSTCQTCWKTKLTQLCISKKRLAKLSRRCSNKKKSSESETLRDKDNSSTSISSRITSQDLSQRQNSSRILLVLSKMHLNSVIWETWNNDLMPKQSLTWKLVKTYRLTGLKVKFPTITQTDCKSLKR